MKKLFAALAIVSVQLLSPSVHAQNVPPPTIAAKSWLLLDATSGQVLASDNANMRVEPASLAKLMTAYVASSAIKEKRLDPNQMVNVSVRAWKVDPSSSKMFIDPAKPVKVNDLLYGLIIQSGNAAAVALAEAVAGTDEPFVTMMNREAERMGLRSTHFATAHGPITNGDRRLIAVVVGTVADQMRTQETQKLLNWGFQNFDTIKLYAKGQAVATPEVWKGSQRQVKIGFNQDVYVTVPKGVADKMKPVLERKDPLVAPVAQNSKVGMLKMMVDGKPVTELPVLALEQVNQATIFGRAWDSVRLWLK